MNIAELKTAGFNEQEIGEYVSDKRNTLLQADFNDTEINNYFGIDSNVPEFKDIPDSNAASERTGKVWDKGFELNLPTNTIRNNLEKFFPNDPLISDPLDKLKETGGNEKTQPLTTLLGDLKTVPQPDVPQFNVAPEHNNLMETIFGYEGLAKPESYWTMNPIKQAAFDVYMGGRNILTRMGGAAGRTAGVIDSKETLDLYNDELVNNPKWYQYSPEVAGFAVEQVGELYAMKGLWNVTRLGKLFGWGREVTGKLTPFLSKEITVRGGTEVLPTLSREGLKQLGKDATISFLKNAPENIAFLETWMVGKAALTGEDKSEAAWSALLWSGGFSIFTPVAGAGSKIFMATSVGEKVKTAAQEAYKELWINFPRMMNAGRKPFNDEYFAAARKWFKNQFGYYPNPAEEAQLKEATRRVGQKVTEAAEKNAATNAYWNSGKEAAKTVVAEETATQQAAKTTETPAQTAEIQRTASLAAKSTENAGVAGQVGIGDEIFHTYSNGQIKRGRIVSIKEVPTEGAQLGGTLYEMRPNEGGQTITFWGDKETMRLAKPITPAPSSSQATQGTGLIRAYHGTTANFETFDKTKIGKNDFGTLGEGFYFTDNVEHAKAGGAGIARAKNVNVKDVYLVIKNPYKTDKFWETTGKSLEESRAFTEGLKKQGYDGIIASGTDAEGKPVKWYVVFDSSQIKATQGTGKQTIPPELEPLAQEARKYKTAEEFDAAIKTVTAKYNNGIIKTTESQAGNNVTTGKLTKKETQLHQAYLQGLEKIGGFVKSKNLKDDFTDFYKQATQGTGKQAEYPDLKPTGGKKGEGKTTYTSVPEEWKQSKKLYDWGQKGLRAEGNEAYPAAIGSKKTRKSFIWQGEFDKVPVRLPRETMSALRAKTDEIWKVQTRKGEDYYIVPKKVLADVKSELGTDAFIQGAKPIRSPKQLLNDFANRVERAKNITLDDIGTGIEQILGDLGLTEADLNSKLKRLLDEYRNEKANQPIRESVSKGVEEKISITPEERAEREAIQNEQTAGEIGDFLNGLIEEPRQTDLLGRPLTQGGASGKQQEFLDKENFKTLQERERINAASDLAGQGKIDEFVETIKKPKRVRGKLEPGMVDVSGVTEAVKEVIDNGITYVKETFETGKDAIEALKFYPNVPMELRNAIRTDIIGAGNQAGHRIYGVLSPNLMGSLPREDIEKAAQIFYAKDEIARTKAGKGNPDLTIEDAQAIHDDLVAVASPEVLKVVENLAKIQKTYTDVLTERGLIDPDNLLDDYARHYVLDYTPEWAFKRGLPPMKLRTPFRGYTKKAEGTTKEYARTMESILFSFYEKELDNIVADFIEEQTAKYNILPTLSKEKKIELFGANKRGTPNKPKPGRIIDIDGKRYRSFSPDAPFARTFYRTEKGEMAMGGLKHISVIPEDIYNAFNSFSQRGGAIIYRINQVTRLWKSMAILSHYTGFTLNNIIGDTLVAVMQHPEPEKFIAEYSTALKYLTGKGEGQFYKDLEKFITDNDIVQGMLTSTELAHFKNNANPLNIVMNALQGFSEKREAVNRVAYAASLLREQQSGRGGELVKAHDWIDTEGLSESAALGKIARDVEVDYKWVSKSWARYVSGLAAPFGTWYFKMSNNVWRWALKHWGKALVTFLAAPVASTFYNDRSKESRDLEKGLPDSIRNRVHFVLGKTADGKTRVLSLQLPQDALIGTKIFTIATAYVNRVALGEMTAEEAAIKILKEWGYKETAGMVSLMAPLGRFIYGLASADRRDPYDKSPIYSKDPKELTTWEYRKQTALYGIKVMTPFLSASISSYEKGLPQDMAWKQSLDTIIGKRAFGLYDINPKSEIEVTLDSGKKITLSWDDNAKIEWIYQQESHVLDHFENAFVAAGTSPEEFYKSPQAQKQLLAVHKLWNDFAPDLNKNSTDKEKAEFVVGQLGERLLNRIFSAGTLSKWYQVKLNRAKTDEDKTKLGQEYKKLMAFKIEEAIKKQPKTSRQAYMAIKLADSDIPVELLWDMP